MAKSKGKWGSKTGDKEKHFYVPDGNETAPNCRQFGSSVLNIHAGGGKKKCKDCTIALESE